MVSPFLIKIIFYCWKKRKEIFFKYFPFTFIDWWIPLVVVKHVDGMNLTLHHVSRTDMGAYMCIASNRIPPSVSKRFEVKVNCKWNWLMMVVIMRRRGKIRGRCWKSLCCRVNSRFTVPWRKLLKKFDGGGEGTSSTDTLIINYQLHFVYILLFTFTRSPSSLIVTTVKHPLHLLLLLLLLLFYHISNRRLRI